MLLRAWTAEEIALRKFLEDRRSAPVRVCRRVKPLRLRIAVYDIHPLDRTALRALPSESIAAERADLGASDILRYESSAFATKDVRIFIAIYKWPITLSANLRAHPLTA